MGELPDSRRRHRSSTPRTGGMEKEARGREEEERRKGVEFQQPGKEEVKERKEKEEKEGEEGKGGRRNCSREEAKEAGWKIISQEKSGSGVWKHRVGPESKDSKKLMKRTKKKLKKGNESEEDTGGSSSTSSTSEPEELMNDRSKIQRISELAPGLLSAQSLEQMRQHLVQFQGRNYDAEEGAPQPLLTLYVRQYLFGKVTGGVQREVATLAWAGDQLLRGAVAPAVDTILQRLKSIEHTSGGVSWSTSQKLELVPPAEPSIGLRTEYQSARKEAKMDQDLRPGGQGKEGKGKKQDKGKEKGGGKGKGKQKGQDAPKNQGSWKKMTRKLRLRRALERRLKKKRVATYPAKEERRAWKLWKLVWKEKTKEGKTEVKQ